MNLVIDFGNTRTKIALFNEGELMYNLSVDNLHTDQIKMLLKEHPSLDKAIVSSVKDYSHEISTFLNKKFKLFIKLNSTTPLPIENLYESKETLGNDRIAGVVGASELFPGENLLIIDAGSAITFDIINEKRQYLGGKISPGLQMRFKALHSFTNRLPLIYPSDEIDLLGNTTKTSIQAGVQSGLIYEIEYTINTFKKIYENLKVILTGGDSIFFEKQLKSPFFVNFNLIAFGLNRILDYNGEII